MNAVYLKKQQSANMIKSTIRLRPFFLCAHCQGEMDFPRCPALQAASWWKIFTNERKELFDGKFSSFSAIGVL